MFGSIVFVLTYCKPRARHLFTFDTSLGVPYRSQARLGFAPANVPWNTGAVFGRRVVLVPWTTKDMVDG